MFRMWCKVFHANHLIKDTTIIDNDCEKNRTRKVFDALAEACNQFNVGHPLWLDLNIKDFKKYSKTRFYQDNFMETIDFDYLEIHIIEED